MFASLHTEVPLHSVFQMLIYRKANTFPNVERWGKLISALFLDFNAYRCDLEKTCKNYITIHFYIGTVALLAIINIWNKIMIFLLSYSKYYNSDIT